MSVELVLPADARRSVVRVRHGGGWVGDLLFATPADRDAFLAALTAGEVATRPGEIPSTDWDAFDKP